MEEGSFPECPIARGLFLCDFAIVEEKTKNVSLINLLDRFRAFCFPSPPKSFVAYALQTDGYGEIDMRSTLEDTEDGREIYEYEARLKLRDRLRPHGFLLRIKEFFFSKPGIFRALLYAKGSLVAQTRIEILS